MSNAKPSTGSSSGGAAKAKSTMSAASGGATKSKSTMSAASGGATKSKSSMSATSGGATKSKSSMSVASGGATKSKSTMSVASGGTSKAAPVSDQSKREVERRRMNRQMVQNVLLIWLDNNIDENDDDCRHTLAQLRRVVNTICPYTDGEECIQFLETMENEKVCMVISGSLGQIIVPCVHDMFQVDSIFIFCGNQKRHERWAKDWHKIKGVFTEIAPICEALKQAAQQCEHNAIPMSFMATNGDVSNKKLDQLDPSFMYTQILKEILLAIHFERKHFDEFIEYCCEMLTGNAGELQNVNKLQKEYRHQTPIWWYTYDCFLYPMLNRSLRLMNVDMMIKMGFFIGDLHRHIDQLYQEQYGNQNSTESFIVYRGQGMSKPDFDQMSNTRGVLISFNTFLSTSKNRTVSLQFANSAITNPDLMGVLFVMNIDPSQSTTPFASIADISDFKHEDEILFSMHTVFCINNIKPMGGNPRLHQVDLTLTNDDDKDLRQLTDRIREETEGSTGWDQLSVLLLKIGEPKKAEEIYNILLDQVTEEIEQARIYYGIGRAKYGQGEYKDALRSLEKSLKIQQQSLPPNHPDLAASYNNIGAVYDNMSDSSKALSSYEKALAIQLQSLPPNHPDLAMSYNNIANAYFNMGESSKALLSHEKALAIRQQSLPPNHPDLASSYLGIGNVYINVGEYSKALSSYEKALAIQQQSLPPNHPNLASSYGNIGRVYDNMGEYSKALSYYENTLAIQQQSLPPNHPDLAASYNNIGAVYDNMGDSSKALSSHEKALAIRQQSLPPNHPDLAKSYNNIGVVYSTMGDSSKALLSHEKALAIRQQSLPPNHPDLAGSYNNSGVVYENMGEYSKARQFYQRAVKIGERSLPSDHPSLKGYRRNLDRIKKN